jgi:hypothetical protein
VLSVPVFVYKHWEAVDTTDESLSALELTRENHKRVLAGGEERTWRAKVMVVVDLSTPHFGQTLPFPSKRQRD